MNQNCAIMGEPWTVHAGHSYPAGARKFTHPGGQQRACILIMHPIDMHENQPFLLTFGHRPQFERLGRRSVPVLVTSYGRGVTACNTDRVLPADRNVSAKKTALHEGGNNDRVESGEWRVESGEWRVESGEWRVEREIESGPRRLCTAYPFPSSTAKPPTRTGPFGRLTAPWMVPGPQSRQLPNALREGGTLAAL